ncbi:MAG: 50S ribosomal protein L25 [Candidatus Moranbacteria bacterium]|nr:50S ribosomal protein L25 [Candidatus Moranbacteria bacterium]
MTEKIILKSKIREVMGKKIKVHRKAGLIPAVLYGNKITSRPLWVNYSDFEKSYDQAGESTILELDIDGKNKANVLIHDVQIDPLSEKFSHIDFFQVRMDQKIETEIPLEFIGESEAVKALGGVLVKSIDAIPINCLPADLPAKIEVDTGALKTFDDVIKISDLNISDKVKILVDTETVVANVAPPRSEEELAKLEEKVEEDVAAIEGVAEKAPVEEVASKEEEAVAVEKKE